MSNRLIFLGDVHLAPWHPERAELFFAFLDGQRQQAEAIYVLGDLFDFWVGARQRRLPEWAAFLERLGAIARDGPAIRILGGNRDYLLDPPSLAPYGLEGLGMEHRFEHDGHTFHLIHGHMQFPDSLHSRLFLRFIQSRLMCFAARAVPLWTSLFVAGTLRRWRRWINRQKSPAKTKRYHPAAFLPFFDAGADVVVCGHNHWPKDYTHQLARPGCRLLAIGNWSKAPSYLEYADGTLRLIDPRIERGAD